jgi:hypothetical protein
MSEPTRNSETLADFAAFCLQHPELRFWQALRVWADVYSVLVTPSAGKTYGEMFRGPHGPCCDTFPWEGRNG